MKFALFFALLISIAASAQKKPTKAEIDKMMKQAMEMSKRGIIKVKRESAFKQNVIVFNLNENH
jgi:hypothetical protein